MVNKTIKAVVAALVLGLTAQVSAYDWSFQNSLPVDVKVTVVGVGAGVMRQNVEGVKTSNGIVIPARTTDRTSFRFGWPTEPGYPGICMESLLIGVAPELEYAQEVRPSSFRSLGSKEAFDQMAANISNAVSKVGGAAKNIDIKGSAQYIEMAAKAIGQVIAPAMELYGMSTNTCRNRHFLIAMDENEKIVIFTYID